jgi:hypothetical protein
MKGRPSYKELSGKIKKAKELFLSGKFQLITENDKVITSDLDKLGVISAIEQKELISEALHNIRPEDYAGSRPPEASRKSSIERKELFAFCYDSELINQRLYIKFALGSEMLFFVSFHKSTKECL